MKNYFKELIILLIQLFMFYAYPLLSPSNNPFGMVMMIEIVTFILSIIIVKISRKTIKYIYPIIISLLFIPSVLIYYNESAFIHSLWYLIISYIGIGFGKIISK